MQNDVISRPIDGQDYAALRQSGTSPARARLQLKLAAPDGERLERLFRARTTRGVGDSQLPRFARHEAHVAACRAQGGFWALSERRIGRDLSVVCLPLMPPAP
ncbi:hypothetical protein [Phenylobacterium aquaticum]|uniref:hypothetical protein n=1 Tax=Phenylobacterium aquaticum TaxID=1763816 RepID=UPI0026E96D57|nr:hypothetical protein [Phenylobacterium aquaticum]